MKRSGIITIVLILVLGLAAYKALDYYVFTIKVHVPVFGDIDTGFTKYEWHQFETAQSEYKEKEQRIKAKMNRGELTDQEYFEEMTKINNQRLSDPRITAVTGGPAKQLLKFILDKL